MGLTMRVASTLPTSRIPVAFRSLLSLVLGFILLFACDTGDGEGGEGGGGGRGVVVMEIYLLQSQLLSFILFYITQYCPLQI